MVPVEKLNPIEEKIYNYFDKRGISRPTLNELRVSNGKEYMPQIQKEVNVIMFNYYVNNKLINVKYRDGLKNFKLFKGAQKTF